MRSTSSGCHTCCVKRRVSGSCMRALWMRKWYSLPCRLANPQLALAHVQLMAAITSYSTKGNVCQTSDGLSHNSAGLGPHPLLN